MPCSAQTSQYSKCKCGLLLARCRFIPRHPNKRNYKGWVWWISFCVRLQTWREPLLQLSFTWLDIVGQHLKRLVPALLEKETWRPVEVTQDDVKTTRSSLTSKVMKISKQQLFTQSCNSAFRRVQHDMQPLVQVSFLLHLTKFCYIVYCASSLWTSFSPYCRPNGAL